MSTVALKDFKLLESYTKAVERKLIKELWDMVYKPMFKIVKMKALNSSDIILDAIKSNKIYYDGNGFKAVKKFSNRVSKKLIELGAIYNRYEKKYIISLEKLPDYMALEITESIKRANEQLKQLNEYLQYVEMNTNQIVEEMIFDSEVGDILDDTQKKLNINVLELDLPMEERKSILKNVNSRFKLSEKEIEKNYTANLQHYTKKWLIEKVPEFREKIQKAVLEGAREDEVKNILIKEYGIMERKAKFLAQNETSIMIAQLKKAEYSSMGFKEFVWNTILDSKERPDHRKLNGKICRFDNPPVIDERTGQRGLPGETYNCRCGLTPIRRDSLFFDKADINRLQEMSNYADVMEFVP